MASYKKTKGNKFEKEVLTILRENNVPSQRVVASGSVKEDSGDIIIGKGSEKYNIECKFHKTIPIAGLEKWKEDNDILIMRQNRDTAKVYMDLETFIRLII